MNKKWTKLLSLLCTVALLAGLLVVPAAAAGKALVWNGGDDSTGASTIFTFAGSTSSADSLTGWKINGQAKITFTVETSGTLKITGKNRSGQSADTVLKVSNETGYSQTVTWANGGELAETALSDMPAGSYTIERNSSASKEGILTKLEWVPDSTSSGGGDESTAKYAKPTYESTDVTVDVDAEAKVTNTNAQKDMTLYALTADTTLVDVSVAGNEITITGKAAGTATVYTVLSDTEVKTVEEIKGEDFAGKDSVVQLKVTVSEKKTPVLTLKPEGDVTVSAGKPATITATATGFPEKAALYAKAEDGDATVTVTVSEMTITIAPKAESGSTKVYVAMSESELADANAVKAVEGYLTINVTVTKVDATALQTAINAAQDLLDETTESTDGNEVPATEKWAPKADIDTFKTAIETATAALKTVDSEDAVTSAVNALTTAQTTFEAARKDGAKVAKYTITVTNPTGATITTDPAGEAAADTQVTVTVNVTDTAKELDKITVTDADQGNVTVTDGKFTMPAKNVTVTATLKAKEQQGGDEPPVTEGATWKFDATTDLVEGTTFQTKNNKDQDVTCVIIGTKFGNGKIVAFGGDNQLEVKTNSDGSVAGVQVKKGFQSGFKFTIPEGSIPAKVQIGFASTGGSNTSMVGLYKGSAPSFDSATKVDEKNYQETVTGTKATVFTYEDVGAGTYYAICDDAVDGQKDARVITITVTFGDGGGTTEPTKNPPVLTLSSKDVTVAENESTTVTATATNDGEIKATSADEETATAEYKDGNVTITGVKEGTTTVTVTATNADGEDKETINVTVTAAGGGDEPVEPPEPTEPTIQIVTRRVTVGVKTKLVANVSVPKDVTYDHVYWTSDDTTVLTVTGEGEATGLKTGTAKVHAYALKTASNDLTTDNILVEDDQDIKVDPATTSGGGGGGYDTTGQTTTPAKTETTTNDSGDTVTTESKTNGDKVVTVTDESGEVVAKVEIAATVPELSYKFEDVPDDHWAAKAINEVAALGIVQGVSADEHVFDMNSAITRAAMAQILFNLSQGKSGKENTFADAADGWYTDAIAWAASAGVVTGYSADTFGPNDSITRQQLVTMLYRYAKLLDLDVSKTSDLTSYVDGDAVDSWAAEAMAWAVGAGLIQGKGHNDLDPTAAASRAETAVVMDRFLALVK